MLPRPGQIARVRSRRWLVEDVEPPAAGDDRSLVRLSCLDDDHQGAALMLGDGTRRRSVAKPWAEMAPAASVGRPLPATCTPGWHCVTATDPRLFQALARASSRPPTEPLRKALLLREPLHRRRRRARQDDRGGADSARTDSAPEGAAHRRRHARFDSLAVAGRTRGALRARLRDLRPRLCSAHAPRPRLGRQSVEHALALPRLARTAARRNTRRTTSRLAWRLLPGLLVDPRAHAAPARARSTRTSHAPSAISRRASNIDSSSPRHRTTGIQTVLRHCSRFSTPSASVAASR